MTDLRDRAVCRIKNRKAEDPDSVFHVRVFFAHSNEFESPYRYAICRRAIS